MINERKKKTLIKHLTDSMGNITYACQKTGISRPTYYKLLREDEEFKRDTDMIMEMSVDMAESKLIQQINDGNLTAIIFYLKTKGKNRGYVERREESINASGFMDLMKELPDIEEPSHE